MDPGSARLTPLGQDDAKGDGTRSQPAAFSVSATFGAK